MGRVDSRKHRIDVHGDNTGIGGGAGEAVTNQLAEIGIGLHDMCLETRSSLLTFQECTAHPITQTDQKSWHVSDLIAIGGN